MTPHVLGRYAVFDAIGGGGMATVHLGRLLGPAGFSRIVAVKRIHPQNAKEPSYVTMLLDEARLAARIRHPNVMTVLDVVVASGEVIVVMEYVHGAPLSLLAKTAAARGERVPVPIAARVMVDVLSGLHAAHEAKSEKGRPLALIHRDVSPQNVLIGDDGVARIADFGVAKAKGKLGLTGQGEIKGKLAYMAPEQLQRQPLDRRVDVYASGIVLWELLTGRRFVEIEASNLADAIQKILDAPKDPPSRWAEVPPALEAVVMKALRQDPGERWSTAEAMASALDEACEVARPREVATWLLATAAEVLAKRAELVANIEEASAVHDLASVSAPAPEPAAPEAEPSRGSKKRRRVVGAVVLALFVAGVFVVALGRTPRAAPVSLATASADAEAAEPSAVAFVFPQAPQPTASAIASVDAATIPLRRRTGTKTARPSPDCDPPYSIDSQGIHVPRRECFEGSRSIPP